MEPQPAASRYVDDSVPFGLLITIEPITHGIIDDSFIPDAEGRKNLRVHATYERSARNRGEALRCRRLVTKGHSP